MKSAACFDKQFEYDFISSRYGVYPVSGNAPRLAFLTVSGLLFVASAMVTAHWCNSMSTMGEMRMPGGWIMSMAWMRLPGQTWIEASASFLTMWIVMMAAMMLPSLAPMLWRYRQAIDCTGELRLERLTLLAGLGYFLVWTLFGLAIFPLGVMLATTEMDHSELARAVPVAIGVVILIAGAVQFTSWKAHHLACCRGTPERGQELRADERTAWRQGVSFGMHCGLSCANLTAILLVVGIMDLRIMIAVTAAITAERLAPSGQRVAQAIGAVGLVAGLFVITRAAGLR
ncbi:MAG: DUF2182 domain-containing protein [Terracidiphilus sp.]